MIKSFHSLPPEQMHTYLIMEQDIGCVNIIVVNQFGDHVKSGLLMHIDKTGVHLHRALNKTIDIEKDRFGHAMAFNYEDQVLRTHREWERLAIQDTLKGIS